MNESTDYEAVTSYLYGLKSAHGVKYGIDRMRAFARALGDPQSGVPCIHVAGTNGKGSVSAMLESIYRHTGLRTGLYTSPHLVKLGERVQVDRRLLTPDELSAYVAELRPLAEKLSDGDDDGHPSFFEFMTAMAFLQFQRKGCDLSVLEVGLGGRLDATNIVLPEVSVISSIGMDHCEILGSTHAAIAREKAGIVKPGRPVVIGRLPEEAEAVVREVARNQGAPIHSVAETYGDLISRCPETNLSGDYQRWNAATARLTVEVSRNKWPVDDVAIAKGLARVDWPGRWQQLRLKGRELILDSSHNPEGARVLEENLERLVAETGRAPVVIVGVLGVARAVPLLETVARYAKELHLVVPAQARSCSHADLRQCLPASFRGVVRDQTVEALFPEPRVCAAGGPDDVVVITGSIYLAGEIMARLDPQHGAGEGWLQDF